MSQIRPGEWKEIDRNVDAVLRDFRTENTEADYTQWLFARAIRELKRMLGEAKKDIAHRDYIDNLGSDGPSVGDYASGEVQRGGE